MKRLFLLSIVFLSLLSNAQTPQDTVRHEVLLQTSKGDVLIALYNETPQHRDNFLKLVNEGFYDDLLFHRVIFRFMIQAGDSASRNAAPGELLGKSSVDYKIPQEILFPKFYHKRGALSAARESDETNPERNSSGSQFFIVYGRRYNDEMLDEAQAKLDEATGGMVKLTPEIRQEYMSHGGCPSLDGQYTVFGEVIEGIDIIDDIQRQPTDENNRPIEDIRIIKATQVK